MPHIVSLQDVILALNSDRSAENSSPLRVADMIIAYHNRPAHEITLQNMKKQRRYFPLYLSFLRIPLNEVDPIVELADLLLARAARIHKAQLRVKNCISQDTSAHAHPAVAEGSVSMRVTP